MKTIKQLSVLLFSTLLALPHFAFSNTALKDENLHIYFCGTGNPDPSKQWLRHPSCLAVAYDNQFFLIDSGAGASLRLSEMGLPVHQISHVFLTHLHSDHFAGLGPIINESWIFGRTAKLKVHGPYGLKKVIHGIHESYAPDVWFRSINRQGKLNPNISGASTHIIDLKGKKNKTVFQDKQLTLTAYPVQHEPVFPAFVYLLHYKNCSVFVTGDTRVFSKEADIVRNVDVMISEAMSHPLQLKRLEQAKQVSQEAYEFSQQIVHYHSDTLELAKLAQKAKVKHLFLTHLDPSIDTSAAEKAAFTAGMSKDYSGPIIVADDMDEIIISSHADNHCTVTYKPSNASVAEQ